MQVSGIYKIEFKTTCSTLSVHGYLHPITRDV